MRCKLFLKVGIWKELVQIIRRHYAKYYFYGVR